MLRAFLLLFVGTILLTAFLSPLVYSSLQAVMDEVPWPYSRVLDRVALVVALVLVYALRKRFELETLRPHFRDWGRGHTWRAVLLGLCVSLATTLWAMPLVVRGGELVWAGVTPRSTLLRFLEVLPAGLVIGLIEESFFRVLFFEKLRERIPTVRAAILCSLLYALLHFISPAKDFVYPGWSPTVGLEYFGVISSRYLLPGVAPGIFGLFLVGLTLCWVIRRTGSLPLCVGLHAGWVVAVKLMSHLTDTAPGVQLPSGAGRRYFLVSQPEAWASIGTTFLVIWWLARARRLRMARSESQFVEAPGEGAPRLE